MPVTQLDERTALVTIDLQNMLKVLPLVVPLDDVVGNAKRLAAAFRSKRLPVINVRVSFAPDFADAPMPRADGGLDLSHLPEGWDQHLAELGAEPTDVLVTKHQFGAFYGTDLEPQLRRRRITGIVLAGAATGVGVESTARAAADHGYNVTVASDAVTDINPATHANALEHVFPLFAEVDTTDAIIAKLESS
jgi:nicotinamidase-related amidase